MSKNTLFNYFTKKSKDDKSVETPQKPKADDPAKNQNVTSTGVAWKLGDLLWARLEGYPWWPSIVCNHPTSNTHIKTGKSSMVHVQFFDDPPSRSWIRLKYLKEFTGSDCKEFQTRGGPLFTTDPECRKGAEQADDALGLSNDDRLKSLVVELQPSESDDSEDEAEDLKLDGDIFDAEMESDGEADSSKENHVVESNNNGTPKKTPSKSPKKSPSKSTRKSTRATTKPDAKRRRIMDPDSDPDLDESEDEYKPSKKEAISSEDDSSGVDEGDVSDIEGSDPDTPVKAPSKRKKSSSSAKKTNKKSMSSFSFTERKPRIDNDKMEQTMDDDDDDDETMDVSDSENKTLPKSENKSSPKSENETSPKSENKSSPKSENKTSPKSENENSPKKKKVPTATLR